MLAPAVAAPSQLALCSAYGAGLHGALLGKALATPSRRCISCRSMGLTRCSARTVRRRSRVQMLTELDRSTPLARIRLQPM